MNNGIQKDKTVKIAVTGGAASGKTSVCRYLREKGLTVISLDDLSRELMMPGKSVFNRVVEIFGGDFLFSDGTLDRAALRALISGDPDAKTRLEGVVQPAILEEMERLIRESESRKEQFVVVEVPLLFELGMEKKFDINVLVSLDEEEQVKRLMERDCVSEEAARRLIAIQMPLDEKRTKADIVIDNSGSTDCMNLTLEHHLGNIIKK